MAKQPIKDPKGGLTAAGRAHFKRTEGANLKPGVKGAADTPEKMRRKGSFLTRFFTNPSGPMTDDKGKPTRLALSAAAWGEPVPKSRSDAAKLAAKGRRLLERYESVKKHAQHNQEDHGNRSGGKGKTGYVRNRQPVGSSSFSTRMSGTKADIKHPDVLSPSDILGYSDAWDDDSDSSGKFFSAKDPMAVIERDGKRYEFKLRASVSQYEGDDDVRWSVDLKGLNSDFDGGAEGYADSVDAAKEAARKWAEEFKIEKKSVAKHARHNQEDHGSWARKGKGGSSRDRGSEKLEGLTRATGKRAEQLESMAKAGGFTFNPKRNEMRSSGFVSAVSTEYEEKHEIGEFNAQTIRDYAAKHAEMLAKPNHHLGAWTTTGPDGKTYVYLDVSVVMNSAKEAADMGRKYNQLAIFDLNTFTEWNRYKNPDGEDVYMPVAPYMEGMFSMAKSDGKKGEGVMLIPGEMLDEDGIAAIMAHVQAQSSSQKPDKSAKNS